MRKSLAVSAGVLVFGIAAHAQTIDSYYSSNYSYTNLGPVAGLPGPAGGLTVKQGDPYTLLIGGSANNSGGSIYSIGLTRDANSHITGFTGSAQLVATAPNIDGGLAYGPGGVLFSTGYPINTLMQHKPGSSAPDKTISLNGMVGSSVGAVNFVPSNFGGAGHMKIVSYNTGQFYDATVSPDGTGTFDVNDISLRATITSGPEGFVYVPLGSPLFGTSILVSEYGGGRIAAYDVDANGDPIVNSRRNFMTGLGGAEGAFIDPLTGDFLFSTFGGGDRVIRVSGFAVPEPSTLVLFGLGALALVAKRRRTIR